MWERLTSELRHRWRVLVHRQRADAELDQELRFHLEQEARKLEAGGMAAEDALRTARVRFGSLERIKDDTRDVRGVSVLDQGWSDLRYVVRALRARPAFTIGVAGTLALGLGANAAMFGIVDRLMYRPPSGLTAPGLVHRVHLGWTENGERRHERSMPFPRFRDFVRETRSLEVVGAFQVRTVALGRGDATHEGRVAVVSASFLDLFGAPTVRGRWFTAAEDEPPSGASVVVLSYDYWMSRYGGRMDALGTQLQVDRLNAIIIGVAPAGFVGISDAAAPSVFVPMSAFAHSIRGPSYVSSYNWGWLQLAVRLRPGVTPEVATADLTNAYHASWRAEAATGGRPNFLEKAQPSVTLGPVQLGRGPDARLDTRVTFWLTGVALIVLLIACANITNLFLSRSVSRQRELAMRLALGVGRGRLARQLLLESLTLGVLGGMGGVLLARYAGVALRALLLPDAVDAAVLSDPRTMLFAFVLALLAGALTAVVPAALATRIDVAAALKAGGRSASHRRSRIQGALVVVQAALSVLLLVGAALFVRSLQRAQGHRLGYDVAQVLYAEVNLRGTALGDSAVRALAAGLIDAARSVSGVTHATMATSVPFWSNESRQLFVAGVDSLDRMGDFTLQTGSGEYFMATGTRIVKGRPFGDDDREGTAPVAVVSEGMARAIWSGRDAIGQCFRVNDRNGPCRTVIGIAEDGAMQSFESSREFTYYLPVAQFPDGGALQFFLRMAEGQVVPTGVLRSRLQGMLPGAAYVNVMPMEQLIAPQLRGWQFGATLFAAFGGLALILAALGLHNLLAYEMAQREKELGVRLALGASRRRLLRFVTWQGTRLAALGVGVGLVLAYLAAGPLEALMFQQSTRDPVIFASVGGLLLAVAGLASALPGWRATRLDPNVALRQD